MTGVQTCALPISNEYGKSYSAKDLNATLTYNNTVYDVGENYEDSDKIIFPWTNETEKLVNATVVFKMDIKAGMKPGNYHGTYQFNVTQEL